MRICASQIGMAPPLAETAEGISSSCEAGENGMITLSA